MEVKSSSKYVRLSPKKARDVARAIQGLPVSNALDILDFTPKKAARLIGKTLRTAVADADHNFGLDTGTLVVKEAVIGAAPTINRYKPRAKGAAGPIIKRSSHIYITLSGSAPEKKARKPRKAAAEATAAETETPVDADTQEKPQA
jgi:large subunit ribosomal protein L22